MRIFVSAACVAGALFCGTAYAHPQPGTDRVRTDRDGTLHIENAVSRIALCPTGAAVEVTSVNNNLTIRGARVCSPNDSRAFIIEPTCSIVGGTTTVPTMMNCTTTARR